MRDRRKAPRQRWWTRERVLDGLRLLYQETGSAPTWRVSYRQLIARVDSGKQQGHRRYPSEYAIALYWPSIAEAWRAAGVEVYGQCELLTPVTAQGLNFGRLRPQGERHGRLIILEFAGYRVAKKGRIALWRCLCDCGQERIVQSDRLHFQQECRSCTTARMLEASRRNAALGRAALARKRALQRARETGDEHSLAGAAGAPRATSPG